VTSPAPAAPEREWLPEVDLVKAVAVVTVVWIHAQRSPWDAGISALELWLANVTVFAVPAFLATSGYLYGCSIPLAPGTTRRRLTRILVPYLVASLAAQALVAASGFPSSPSSVARDLLLGASFVIYYYVPQITLFVLLSPLLAMLPRRSWGWIVAIALLAQGAFHAGAFALLSFFWHIRNPLLWAAYFLIGWWAGSHRARLLAFTTERRRSLVVATAGAWVASASISLFLPDASLHVHQAAQWIAVYAAIALLFALGTALRSAPRIVHRLSDATYAIYLWHFFFVLIVRDAVPSAPGVFQPAPVLAAWCAGLLGSLLWIGVARRMLGRHSRLVIGA
jgi:peptidoglycan/LPS O-acetylase OafA/YrhL